MSDRRVPLPSEWALGSASARRPPLADVPLDAVDSLELPPPEPATFVAPDSDANVGVDQPALWTDDQVRTFLERLWDEEDAGEPPTHIPGLSTAVIVKAFGFAALFLIALAFGLTFLAQAGG